MATELLLAEQHLVVVELSECLNENFSTYCLGGCCIHSGGM